MALDDYTYRLKAEAGDTTPHDELGVSGDITGGSPTLVDDGSGGKAWQFTGAADVLSIPSYTTVPTVDGGGATLVVRAAITTSTSTSGARYCGVLTAASPTYGLGLHQQSTTTCKGRYRTSAQSYDPTAYLTHGTTYHTYVIQMHMAAAANLDQLQEWVSGGSGDTPDYTSGVYNVAAVVLNALGIGVAGTVVCISDILFYPHELTDAENRALVDDLRGTVDGGDGTAPVLTTPIGTATGSTTATVGATTDEGNGTMYAVVTTSGTAPTSAQIKAGQDNSGNTAAWSGSVSVTSTGAKTLNATGLTESTTYYAHLIHTDAAANDSNIVSSSSFTTSASDTTAPVLTSPTGTTTGTTTATGTVSTDTAEGTLYYLASTNATETVSTVKAAASQSVTASGTQNVSFSSLSPGTTYYAHYVHTDSSSNDSLVSNSSSFTTNTYTTIISAPIKNNTGTVLANISGWTVNVYNETTGALVVQKTSLTTNSSGILTISDSSLVVDTTYVFEPVHSTYGRRLPTGVGV